MRLGTTLAVSRRHSIAAGAAAPPVLSGGLAFEGVDDVFADVATTSPTGTLYYLVDQLATRTAAQVKASGTAQAVTGFGIQNTGTVTGLLASTAYFIHLMHENALGQSNVIDIAFTTNAALNHNLNADAVEVYDGTFGAYVGSYTPGAGSTGVIVTLRHSAGNFGALVAPPAVTFGGTAMTFIGHSHGMRQNSANNPQMAAGFVYFLATALTGVQTIAIASSLIAAGDSIQVAAASITGGVPRSWRNYHEMTIVQPETALAFDDPFYNNPVSLEAEDLLFGVHGQYSNINDILRFGTATPATAQALDATWAATVGQGRLTVLNPAADAAGTLNYRCAAGSGIAKNALATIVSPRRVKGVTIDEPPPYYVFPRTSGQGNFRIFTLSGKVLGGNAPSAVEARVVCQDGTAVTGWAPLTGASYSATQWSGTYPTPVPFNDFSAVSTANRARARYDKMYLWEVRRADNPSRVHRSTSPFMVGLFLLYHGQFNARQSFSNGKGARALHINSPGFVMHRADENGAAVTSKWFIQQSVCTARLTAEVIMQNLGFPVMAACVAQDSATIQFLSGTANNPYLSLVAVSQKVGHVDAVIWHQGEGNASAGASLSVPSYAALLTQIRGQVKAATGQGEEVKLFLSSLAWTDVATYADAEWAQTLACHYGAAAQDSNVFFTHSNFDATMSGAAGSLLIFDDAGTDRFGERAGYMVAKQFGASALAVPRFTIASAARLSATQTTVNLAHGRGTDFTIDGGGTTAQAAAAFQVSPDGAIWQTCSDFVKVNAAQIVLAHPSIGSGGSYVLRHQYGKNPAARTFLLRDNWVHPITGTAGVPLEPTGAGIAFA